MDLTQMETQVTDLHEKLVALFENESAVPAVALTVLATAMGTIINLYDPPSRFRVLAGTVEILASQIADSFIPETDQ